MNYLAIFLVFLCEEQKMVWYEWKKPTITVVAKNH